MKIEIKNRFSGEIIIAGEYESISDALRSNIGADLRCANLRDADLGCANLIGADLRCANLRGADLIDADLRCANLRGANLRGANLIDADLRCANLRDADLRDADLRCAKGITLPVINISGTCHNFFFMGDIIQIGCERWPVSHWIENYQSIGKNNDYTPEQIAEYGNYIKMIANLIKKENN